MYGNNDHHTWHSPVTSGVCDAHTHPQTNTHAHGHVFSNVHMRVLKVLRTQTLTLENSRTKHATQPTRFYFPTNPRIPSGNICWKTATDTHIAMTPSRQKKYQWNTGSTCTIKKKEQVCVCPHLTIFLGSENMSTPYYSSTMQVYISDWVHTVVNLGWDTRQQSFTWNRKKLDQLPSTVEVQEGYDSII